MNTRGSRAVPGCILHLQTPSPSLYLAGEVTRRFCTFTDKVPVVGRCWWAVPSQGGGDPAFSFSFSKYASLSGLWGKYYVSILSSYLLTLESPGIPEAGSILSMPSDSPSQASALPRHQPCTRLCAGCQAHTDEQHRYGPSTPEALAHQSCSHPKYP